MLRSDWLNYYQAICYSQSRKAPALKTKWRLHRVLLAKVVYLDIFDQLVGFYEKNYYSRPHGL